MIASRPLLLCALLAALGCPSTATDTVALADKPRGVAAPAVDLEALAAQRAASGGAALEGEAAQARAQSATRAFVNRPGEPTQEEGAASPPSAAPGALRYDPLRDANAGSAAPSDLDRGEADAPVSDEPWINMQVVEQKILAQSKAMNACWDNEGPGGAGRIDMRITVGRDGRPLSVGVASGSSTTGPAADCLGRTLRTIRYPEPRGGDITFVYPVKF